MARRLGGGRFAQGLAALCVLVAPVFLAFSTYLSMNPVEALVWAGCAYVVLRLVQTGRHAAVARRSACCPASGC